MPRRAVLAGGSGFIGKALAADLVRRGYAVSQIGRSGPDARWAQSSRVVELIDGSDLLVNLAGRSVGRRYNDRNRDEIYSSRIDTTQQLYEAVTGAESPPRLWLNASTATIYRHAMDRPQSEDDGEIGSGPRWMSPATGSGCSSPESCRAPAGSRCGWPSCSETALL